MTKTNSLEQVIANGSAAYYMWLAEMTCDENCALMISAKSKKLLMNS